MPVKHILIHIEQFLARLRSDERGASLVEYALLVALIVLVCVVAIGYVGGQTSSQLEDTRLSIALAG